MQEKITEKESYSFANVVAEMNLIIMITMTLSVGKKEDP